MLKIGASWGAEDSQGVSVLNYILNKMESEYKAVNEQVPLFTIHNDSG